VKALFKEASMQNLTRLFSILLDGFSLKSLEIADSAYRCLFDKRRLIFGGVLVDRICNDLEVFRIDFILGVEWSVSCILCGVSRAFVSTSPVWTRPSSLK
jgi:hypothetical protein